METSFIQNTLQYTSEIVAVIVAALVAAAAKINATKRDANATVRDSAETNLVRAQNDAATRFVQDIIEDHKRVIAQLTLAERERTTNAQRIGELTTEVNLLREQITEVKTLLQKITKELDDAKRKINEYEGIIIRLEAERDTAIHKWEEREKECRECKMILIESF